MIFLNDYNFINNIKSEKIELVEVDITDEIVKSYSPKIIDAITLIENDGSIINHHKLGKLLFDMQNELNEQGKTIPMIRLKQLVNKSHNYYCEHLRFARIYKYDVDLNELSFAMYRVLCTITTESHRKQLERKCINKEIKSSHALLTHLYENLIL